MGPEERQEKAVAMVAAHHKHWAVVMGSTEPVHASDIPWPGDVMSALQYVPDPRSELRALQLYYHPDKFAQKVGQRVTPQDDLAGLLVRVTDVSQELNAMQDTHKPPESSFSPEGGGA